MGHSDRINITSIGFWFYTLSVVLLPIGFGGDRPIPLGLTQIGLCISAACLSIESGPISAITFFSRLRWALFLMLAVIVWAVLQTQSFLPEAWAHPLWQEAASLLQHPVRKSISIAPEDSWKGLMRLVTYLSTGVIGYIFAQDSRRAKQFVEAFWIAGTAICVYGLITFIGGWHAILWFEKKVYLDDLTATFVNRNHFALYSGITMTAGIALFIQSWRETVRNSKPHERIAAFREWLFHQGLPRATMLIIAFICLVLSHSRAGFFWSLVGIGAYVFFYQIYLRSWKRAAVTGFIVTVASAVTIYMAFQYSERFASLFDDYSSDSRSRVYEFTLRALVDNPLLGYGLNGFEPEYRLYQSNMWEVFNHAHSDVLESLLDLGMIGGLALWAAVALCISGLCHGISRRRHDGLYPTLGLAVTLMVLGHALVDFVLQIPGLAITWTALLGTGLAQSWNHSERRIS